MLIRSACKYRPFRYGVIKTDIVVDSEQKEYRGGGELFPSIFIYRKIITFREYCFTVAQRLMSDDICQHITEDNKVCGKGGQFFFGQTFAELAGDRGEIKKVGTAVHTCASVQSLVVSNTTFFFCSKILQNLDLLEVQK